MSTDTQSTRLLERAARASIENPALIGSSLNRLAHTPGDLQDVAREVGLTHETTLRLALCLRPRQSQWLEDVERLARTTAIAPDLLVGVLRQLDALDALASDERSELLLAARRDYGTMDGQTQDEKQGDVDPER